MANVKFDNINKVFPDGTHVIHDLSLDIEDGEFMILVGPSGCGKSTALRMVAGLESITSGEMSIGDQVVNDLSPKERDIAMVFQSYALYPHMTVADNMGFALKLSKVPQSEIDSRVKEAADVLGLTEYLHRKPKALSGGQRQRVAMGRAIVRSPKAFLMDEPLSNLDAKLRVQMRAEIAALQNRLGVTTLYVTHDQVEAMTMGDRVAVLRKGVLMQADAPQVLYDHPDNLFVASFIGSPSMNMAEVGVVHEDDGLYIQLDADNRMRIHDAAIDAYPRVRDYAGKRIAVGMRPEHFFPATGDTPAEKIWPQMKIELVEMLGSEMLVHLGTHAQPVVSEDMREAVDDEDAFAALQEQARAGGLTVVARFPPAKAPAIDSTMDVGFKTELMHFFDFETGAALR
ncbi:MAG TPA: sn-glycerol-3-phosphate ABC transporter ATP-binding protein UgpC [Euzebya sp.]|nr:sn-glycerol-3-phosphate ABC transporter ATP-binding protein UgpC [Euzebya sp.]